jgi:hypothetical protein
MGGGVIAALFLAGLAATAAPSNPAADIDQCRNGAFNAPVDCEDVAWVNGNAGASNAHYVEGYSISYRVRMSAVPTSGPNSTVTLVLGYDIRHSNTNALDFLTQYEWNDVPDHQFSFGHPAENVDPTTGTAFSGDPDSTFAIPTPTPLSAGALATFNAIPAEKRVMSLWGGNITNVTYTSQGDPTASQSETQIAVTFNATSATPLLAWGGHIARTQDWGTGAAGISGSPYHMRLKSWNLSNLGNQDRSLAAAAVITPVKIITVKQTDPDGDTTKFDFAASWDTGANPDFQLADGESNDSGFLQPGTYSVTETTPTGWDLTSATCDDGSAPGSITLDAGEIVTCTFNNQKDANIIVVKQTDPDGDTADFDFVTDYGALGFTLSDGEQNDSGDLDPGTYSVSETVPAGWDLTSATCSDGSDPASIGLSAGETVTCTFNNTRLYTIIVLVCMEKDNSLYPSVVTLNGEPLTSLSNAQLAGSGLTQEQVCGLGNGDPDVGARFEGRLAVTHNLEVAIFD